MTSTSTVMRAALAAAAWVLALTGSLFLAAPASASTRPVMYGTYGAASGSWQGATIKPPAVYFGTDSVLSVRSLTWAYWKHDLRVGPWHQVAGQLHPRAARPGPTIPIPQRSRCGACAGTTGSVTTPG